MNKFTVKLYFDNKSSPLLFSANEQDSSSVQTEFQQALKRSRDCNSYAACLCTGRELPLAVKLKKEKHHLARFPLTGRSIKMSVVSIAASHLKVRKGLTTKMRSAKKQRDYQRKARLCFAGKISAG